jgi:hypothetical protein
MPRKIKPRYNIDQVQKVPEFSFTGTQIEHLFALLPAAHGNRLKLIAQLECCARTFLWLRNQYRVRWTRAEQNAAFAEIGQLAGQLATRLSCLDMEAEWDLLNSAALPVESLPELSDRLAVIADATERALHLGKQKSGPHRDPCIDRIVPDLKLLYEQCTGKIFSHNPKRKAEYLGRPQSAAGRYVVTFFQAVDPTVTETAISTAMAALVSSKRSA